MRGTEHAAAAALAAPPVPPAARLAAALGISLAAHCAALTLLAQMPRGWEPSLEPSAASEARPLQVAIRSIAAPSAELPRPPDEVKRRPVAHETAAPQRTLGALSEPEYLPARDLDQRPLIRSHVEPRFPEGAKAEAGRVLLDLYINESGSIDRIEVVAAEPAGEFESAALAAFGAASFVPGRKGDRAVKTLLTIEARFGAAPRAEPSVPGLLAPQAPRSRKPRPAKPAP